MERWLPCSNGQSQQRHLIGSVTCVPRDVVLYFAAAADNYDDCSGLLTGTNNSLLTLAGTAREAAL